MGKRQRKTKQAFSPKQAPRRKRGQPDAAKPKKPKQLQPKAGAWPWRPELSGSRTVKGFAATSTQSLVSRHNPPDTAVPLHTGADARLLQVLQPMGHPPRQPMGTQSRRKSAGDAAQRPRQLQRKLRRRLHDA